jgi:Lipid A 3-O-deacylase (PagL)
MLQPFLVPALRKLPFLTVLLSAMSSSAFAGLCSKSVEAVPRQEIQLLLGYSPRTSTLFGTAEGRRFVQAGIAYSYRCWDVGQAAVSYTGTFLPLAMIIQPHYRFTVGNTTQEVPAHAVYGMSALPIGMTFDFERRRSWGVYSDLHGGIIASSERVPIDAQNATGLNFLFDFGGGVRWSIDERSAIRAGYRFLHISNAGTTPFNPGLDNNVLYASWSFLR